MYNKIQKLASRFEYKIKKYAEDCTIPYYINEKGIHVEKPECGEEYKQAQTPIGKALSSLQLPANIVKLKESMKGAQTKVFIKIEPNKTFTIVTEPINKNAQDKITMDFSDNIKNILNKTVAPKVSETWEWYDMVQNCKTPFTFDEKGRKIGKPECE